ncbi:MAG TPA: nuclear transport factor 2 family protein [Candidatus Limnocylindrales bacterium]|nr:nuclear transport factor 2 family protein [Candidatus Limnocylindrales bacterium]
MMRRARHRTRAIQRITAAFALLAMPAAATAAAVTPAAPAAALTLTLTSDRAEYTLGEPVLLSVRVANETAAPIVVRRTTDAATGAVLPWIGRQGEEPRRYVGPDIGIKHTHVPEAPLAPGDAFTIKVRVLFHVVTHEDSDLPYFYAFDQPGTYQVRAEVVNVAPSQRLFTNTIAIRMRAPSGTDAQVWRMLQNEASARFLHSGFADAGSREAAALAEIVERYPASVYAPVIERSLQIHEKSAGPQTRAAAGTAEVVTLPGKTFVATASPSVPPPAVQEASRSIAEIVNAWQRAWNARDAARLMQLLVISHDLRRKWDQGAGDADHEAAVRQLESAFSALGELTIEVVRTSFGGEAASADVLVTASNAQPAVTSRTMRLAREGGAWRISEVGF